MSRLLRRVRRETRAAAAVVAVGMFVLFGVLAAGLVAGFAALDERTRGAQDGYLQQVSGETAPRR